MIINQRRRNLDRALANGDPMVRRAAVDLIDERSLSAHVDTLLERALVETDPCVRADLARAVSHCDWQRGDDPRILQLRAWAGSVCELSDARPAGGVPIGEALHDSLSTSNGFSDKSRSLDDNVERTNMDDMSGPLFGLSNSTPVGEDAPALTGSVIDRALVRPSQIFDRPDTRVLNSKANARTVKIDEPSSVQGETGVDKAQQAAMMLLRSAGYAVTAKSEPILTSEGPVAVASSDIDDHQLLTEVCVQRAITTAIFEEAVRRMRVENDRLEALLARLQSSG
jgi:hypothetical protein